MLSVVVGVAGLTSSCTNQRHADQEATPVLSSAPKTNFPMPPMKPASDMGWVMSDGKRVTLADYQGNVLVLDFYATWCAPCRRSIPRLMALNQKYGTRGVRVVGLNVGGADDRVKASDFAKELGIQYPLGFPDQAFTDLFLSDNQEIPQTFILGREGKLKGRFIGYQDSTGDDVERTVSELLDSKP
jgi:thiol-disulfide isomerase/thioredoxin